MHTVERNENVHPHFKGVLNIFETIANCTNPVFVGTRCKCNNVEVGSYDNQVELPAPQHIIEWAEKVNFSLGGDRKTVCVDRCLEKEIKALWEMGIVTTGCCCGHGKVPPYIGVTPEHVLKMKSLGYSLCLELSGYDFAPMSI